MNNNSHVFPSSSSRQTQLSDEMVRMQIENEHEESVRMDRVLDVCRCTICLQTWASHGDRQVCCLPCGHIYCFSCISKWIQRCRGVSANCPTCRAQFMSRDVRKIYGSPVVVLDELLQERNQSLEAENELLKSERESILKEIHRLKQVLRRM